jgi:hypothetical protein
MKRALISGMIVLILTSSCGLFKKSTSKADPFAGYQEDITDRRFTFESPEDKIARKLSTETAPGGLDVDQDLKLALDRFSQNNQNERFWSGFTVLVYSGVDRDQAFKTRNDLFTYFPDMKIDMQYQQPRYLLKVGKFVNRIEAQAYYHKLRDNFPTARIIPDRFQREGFGNSEPTQDSER